MDSEVNTNNPSRDKLLKLHQNLKQLEFINYLKSYLSKNVSEELFNELDEIKLTTQLNTLNTLKHIKTEEE